MKMKKAPGLFAWILAVAMVFTMMPLTVATVYAAGEYDIWVDGVQVTDGNKTNVLGNDGTPTVTYDSSSGTLTLNNATLTQSYWYSDDQGNDCSGKIVAATDVTIKLVGENMITYDDRFCRAGIVEVGSQVTITGPGSLTMTSMSEAGVDLIYYGLLLVGGSITQESGTVRAEGNNHGVHLDGGTLTVNGGTLVAASSYTISGYRSGGIYSDNGNIIVNGGGVTATTNVENAVWTNGGTLTVNGGTLLADSPEGCGITYDSSSGGDVKTADITVTGGLLDVRSRASMALYLRNSTITVTGGECRATPADDQYGIYGPGSIIVDGGELNATSKYASAIDVGGEITMRSGTLTATSTATSDSFAAIELDQSTVFTIEGGLVEALGTTWGVYGKGGGYLNITGGLLHATGSEGAVNVYANSSHSQGGISMTDNCRVLEPEGGTLEIDVFDFIRDPNQPENDYYAVDATVGDPHVNLRIAKVTLSNDAFTYNGEVQIPDFTVTAAGLPLEEGTDYTAVITDSKGVVTDAPKDAGTYTITLTALGETYSGTKSVTYQIKKKAVTPAVTLSTEAYTYDGKVKKPSVTVKAGSTKLASSQYTVTYGSGRKNVGKYSVKVTLKGNYSGTKTVYFKINPKGTSIKSLTKASKAATVKWTKQSAKMSSSYISGYQIMLATNSKFTTGKKTVNVTGYSKTSKKVTGLKGGKKYYVKIRTYKTVSGVKYYSPWSKVKTVTTGK